MLVGDGTCHTALGIALGMTLVVLSSIFLLLGVRFGIAHGEVPAGLSPQQLATYVDRAGNIALLFFLLTALAGAAVLMKLSRACCLRRAC